MATETAQEWAARLSAADVEAIFHKALGGHDMRGVVYALRLLATKDPHRAQELLDLIQVGVKLREGA
ncbi:hypothetical protein [Dactylosporangium sp. CA-139066]|uniref:hypothetical protein n=1 Tax=Dactylosporangium sp. CA-139066 TaxID=3239930 RepID=UPI003D8F72EB